MLLLLLMLTAFWGNLSENDVCIGTLPMHLAFADQMEECNASIRWFDVQQANGWDVCESLNQ